MNKPELILAIAERTGLSKKDAGNAAQAFIDIVTETLVSGDKVSLSGFGVFEVVDRAAREGGTLKLANH